MMKDNKGFSLLEFIIVLGMAAILAGSAVSFTGYIRYANSKSCAERLYSGIDRLQVTSMAKKDKKVMVVWRKDDEYYYDIYTYDGSTVSGNAVRTKSIDECTNGTTGTKLGNSALTIKYKNKNTGVYKSLDNDDSFIIAYAMDGSYSKTYTDTEEIVVENVDGEGMKYTIKLITDTGKHFLN